MRYALVELLIAEREVACDGGRACCQPMLGFDSKGQCAVCVLCNAEEQVLNVDLLHLGIELLLTAQGWQFCDKGARLGITEARQVYTERDGPGSHGIEQKAHPSLGR